MMGFTSKSKETAFKYISLGSRQRTLRVIKLLPPTRSFLPPFRETLHVEIIERSLGDGVPFDTLSYTWGDVGQSSPNRPIIVETTEGPRVLKIFRSLEIALLSLARREPKSHPIFVDQICINQDDEDEKVSQVKLMGDIYASCHRVIIWLGPGTRRSDEFCHFTSEICSHGVLGRITGPNVGHFQKLFDAVVEGAEVDNEAQREDRDDLLELLQRYGSRYPLQGASDILGRPWFNRLWVIQEACLAPNPVFLKPKVSQKEMRLRNSIFPLSNSFIRTFQQRKALHLHNRKMPLYDLVLKYSVNEAGIKVGATLPEDRIYGLLGLAQDEVIKTNTEVVYHGIRDIYTRFAAAVVGQDLDILLYSQKAESETELPSWVPDWSAARLMLPCGYSELGVPIFSAGGNTINQPPAVDVLKGMLTVQGHHVGRIDRVGIQGIQPKLASTGIEQIDYRSVVRLCDEINEFLELAGNIAERFRSPSSPSSSPSSNQQDLRGAAAINLTDGGLSSRRFLELFDPSTAQALLARIHRHTRDQGRRLINTERRVQAYGLARIIRTAGTAPWYRIPADMVGAAYEAAAVQLTAWFPRARRRCWGAKVDLAVPDRQSIERAGLDPDLLYTRELAHYTSSLYKNIGRRLFLTEGGYLGLGPERMRRGDVVAVLVGGSVPHVLRHIGGDPARMAGGTALATADAHWSYVGEAYCDGIMDGEILQERGEGETTQFRIL